MRWRIWILAITAFFLVAGATWLAVLVWKTSDVGGKALGPHLVGAILAGVVLRRIVGDARAIVLAIGGTVAWIAPQVLLDSPPKWVVPTTSAQYLLLLGVAPLCAAVAAAIPLPGATRETRWRWLSMSALLVLGFMVAPLISKTHSRDLTALGIVFVVGAPLFAGALTQYFATYRWIWACGGGSLVFMLILLDQVRGAIWRDPGGIIGVLCAFGMYILVGAGGAALSWRLFRHRDPRAPKLPTAQVV